MAPKNGLIQRQMMLQKAISRTPSGARQVAAFDSLANNLKNIVRNNAGLDENRVMRAIMRDKYEGEPRLYQDAVRDSYADDNRLCSNINDNMLQINKMCKQYDVDSMFPQAHPTQYSYELVEKAAQKYVEDLHLTEELAHEYELTKKGIAKTEAKIPESETTSVRGTEMLVDDLIEDINREME